MMQTVAFEKQMMTLVAMVAIVLISSVSAQCTPATCPDGPVIVVFAYANCTGPYQFYPAYMTPGCDSGDGVTITDSEIIYYEVDNPQCDLTLANASYSGNGYRLGVCGVVNWKKREAKDEQMKLGDPSAMLARSLALSGVDADQLTRGALTGSSLPYHGMMFLANVNASFSSKPQPYFQYNPSIPFPQVGGYEECYSADNCTLADGSSAQFYETRHSQLNCAGSASSFVYPDTKIGVCYNNFNGSYTQFHCTGDHSALSTYHYGDSCSVPPSFFSFIRSVCSGNSQNTLYCLAAPPSNPTTEPSSAIRLVGGALIAFFCIIASLIASF